MEVELLKKIINDSLKKLIEIDSHLFNVKSSELSFNFRLAYYIQTHEDFCNDFVVDCEFNRVGNDYSKKEFYRNGKPRKHFPDIIIHIRGKQDSNLLAIETKKNQISQNDIDKVEKYISVYEYKLGLVLNYNIISKKPKLKWIP